MKKTIAMATLVLCAVAGAGIAQAGAKAYPDLPSAPAYTSRYPVIDDIMALQNRVDALERENRELREDVRELRGQAGAMVLLRAHDISQRDTLLAEGRQAWQAARGEDEKRLTNLEWSVNRMWEMCR